MREAIAAIDASSYVWQPGTGNLQGQQSVSQRVRGIFVLGREIAFDRKHVSIHVIPSAQRFWLDGNSNSPFLNGPDGMRFATLGAGPSIDIPCAGRTLISNINRTYDVSEPPASLDEYARLAYPSSLEKMLIRKLFTFDATYGDDLSYSCWPESNPGYYNSNSYVSGLLNAAEIALPRFPGARAQEYPGWISPVPKEKFR